MVLEEEEDDGELCSCESHSRSRVQIERRRRQRMVLEEEDDGESDSCESHSRSRVQSESRTPACEDGERKLKIPIVTGEEEDWAKELEFAEEKEFREEIPTDLKLQDSEPWCELGNQTLLLEAMVSDQRGGSDGEVPMLRRVRYRRR